MMYACTSWYWLGPPCIGSLYHCTWFVRAYLQDRAMADISTLPLGGFMKSLLKFTILLKSSSDAPFELPPKILHLIQLFIWYHTPWVVFIFRCVEVGKQIIKATLYTVVSLDENIESWMSQIFTPHELLQSSIFFMLACLEVKSSLSATSPLFRISETSVSPRYRSFSLHLLPLFCRGAPGSVPGQCNRWQHRCSPLVGN